MSWWIWCIPNEGLTSRAPKGPRPLTSRIWTLQHPADAIAAALRVCALFVLVGLATLSAAHAHSAAPFSPAAAADSEIVSPHECCHAADQRATHTDCAGAICWSLSALVGHDAEGIPPHAATPSPLSEACDRMSRTPAPLLHPPISV